jgi:membrane-associated protein
MLDVNHIIQAGGLLLIAALIFGESGMFIGFFFPGDTLLLAGGVFASQGKMSLPLLILVVAVAAVAGDNVGYHIGKRYGHRLFRKPDGLIFRQEYVQQAEGFYEKHGSKTMLVSHFVPVVRTFAPAVAGVALMDYKQFVIFDAIGDCAWALIVSLVGYYFGKRVPNLDHYILSAVAIVVIVTLISPFYQAYRNYRTKSRRASGTSAKPIKDKSIPD